MNRESTRLISSLVLVLFAQGALAADGDWQCATLDGKTTPAIARSASGFLARAGQIYPSQLLGMVRSGGRAYLVNANDGGWGERVRLGLMELRLAEPDITAARRFQATVSGAPDVQMPEGEFVCLAGARAGRHGLALSRSGAVLLAPGKSVHLVDPQEPTIVVEVRAVGSEPLDFREILALSGRSGIYAGLARPRVQPDVAVDTRQPEGIITVALGPADRVNGQIVMTPRARDEDRKVTETPTIVATAAAPPVQAPVVAPVPVPVPLVVEEPPVRVAKAEVPAVPLPVVEEAPVRVAKAEAPVAPPPAKPLPAEAPAVVEAEIAKPVLVAAVARAPLAQEARLAAGQSYDEYAKTMKTLMELRRSGGVRSISEMTYVHPAVEELRARR